MTFGLKHICNGFHTSAAAISTWVQKHEVNGKDAFTVLSECTKPVFRLTYSGINGKFAPPDTAISTFFNSLGLILQIEKTAFPREDSASPQSGKQNF